MKSKVTSRDSVRKHIRKVRRTMASLCDALKPKFGSRNASDLAFNFAEIYAELPELREIIRRAVIKKKIGTRDLRALEVMLTIHWPYHIGQLKRAFKKLEKSR